VLRWQALAIEQEQRLRLFRAIGHRSGTKRAANLSAGELSRIGRIGAQAHWKDHPKRPRFIKTLRKQPNRGNGQISSQNATNEPVAASVSDRQEVAGIPASPQLPTPWRGSWVLEDGGWVLRKWEKDA